jgi:hypothetical protein
MDLIRIGVMGIISAVLIVFVKNPCQTKSIMLLLSLLTNFEEVKKCRISSLQ